MESGMILVVDDEMSIRRALHTTLNNLGFRTVEAARGEEALSLLRTNTFDAVLLDINMPGMSGIDACKSMRSLFPRIPILMLTVRDSEDDKVEALDAGADDYITKPFQLRELTARMRAAMRWSRMPDTQEAAVLRINEIELDPARHTVKKAGRLHSPHPQGIRVDAPPHDPCRQAHPAQPPAEYRVGRRIRQRTGVSPHLHASTAQETGRRSREPQVSAHGSARRLSLRGEVVDMHIPRAFY